MIIQNALHTPASVIKPPVKQTDVPAPSLEPTYFESFQAQAKTEVPRAVTYSAIAGVSLGVAALAFGLAPAFASATQTLALSAAAGAGIGLFSGLASSALRASVPAAPPVAPPTPPVETPPVQTPQQLFLKDMNQAGQILDRRVSGLASLLKAEQIYHDSIGRSGLQPFDKAKELLGIAEQDLAKLNQNRADVVSLVQDKETLDERLGKLRTQQQETLNVQLQASELVSKSIGRSGRLSEQESAKVAKELQQEIARVRQASA